MITEDKVFKNKPVVDQTAKPKIISGTNVMVQKGGWWEPVICTPRWTVAIIIPFRSVLVKCIL